MVPLVGLEMRTHFLQTDVARHGCEQALVTKEMDLNTAMNARAVCKSWRRLVKEADLEPLEAGASEQEKALGREGQQHLEEALDLENQVWTPQHTAKMAQHLTQQQEVPVSPFSPPIPPFPSLHSRARNVRKHDMDGWRQITAEMRKTLVNWLIEVHFKFRFREPCLHLTIQLVSLSLTPCLRRQTFLCARARHAVTFGKEKGGDSREDSRERERHTRAPKQAASKPALKAALAASQCLCARVAAIMVLTNASGVCAATVGPLPGRQRRDAAQVPE